MSNTNEVQALNEKAQFEVVWALMAELGIAEIAVSFNGEGDSGDISDIAAMPPDAEPAWGGNNDPVGYTARRDAWNERVNLLNRAMESTPTGIVREIYENAFYGPDGPPPIPAAGIPLVDLVRALTWPMLNALDHDWVNNDGGYGTVTWGLADRSIHLEVSIRIVSTEEYTYDYDRHGQECDPDVETDTDMAAEHGAEQDKLTGV